MSKASKAEERRGGRDEGDAGPGGEAQGRGQGEGPGCEGSVRVRG